ncbi:MAG: SPOR domain-containing protein [Gemmatirosa sp.]|nr:SPOR domain-containing protein [Gemmatirosa sp.]
MRRFLAVTAAALALAAFAGLARAQPPSAPDSANLAQFARARRLVSDGNGAVGRALVDTLLAAAVPGTPGYAEALYWRATLAERAADGERDYRQLAVEYPASPRAADALVRLAQLDLARGQPATARDHLTRLLRDHTDAPTRARAHYWLARASLDAGDARGACGALNEAAGETEPGGELARQVVALRGRVPRCTLTVAVGGQAAVGVQRAAPAAPIDSTRSAPPVPRPSSAGRFTVQVSAYDSRPGAEALAARLVKRGFEARVTSGGTPDTPPFRVRIGRYATRAEAIAAQRELKAKGLAGFVAEEAEPRP